MCKKSRFRRPCNSQHIKLVSQNLATVSMLNSLKTCTTAFPSHCFVTLSKIDMENIRLSVSEVLRVFVNKLSTNNTYFLCNRKNLPEPIQLQLSKKQKKFSEFFAAYLKSTWNVEQFETKDHLKRLFIFEIRDCETCG